MYIYIDFLYAFQKMSCIYIKLKDIHKVVLYFDSLRIFYGKYKCKTVNRFLSFNESA